MFVTTVPGCTDQQKVSGRRTRVSWFAPCHPTNLSKYSSKAGKPYFHSVTGWPNSDATTVRADMAPDLNITNNMV